MSYGPPPGFTPPPFGYGPPPGPPMPPPNPMNPMGPMGPLYGPPPNHNMAVASMVCGILAIVPGCCCGLFGLPLSIVALTLGLIAINQINASGGQLGGKNMALTGVICGGTAIAINMAGAAFNVTNHAMRTFHI